MRWLTILAAVPVSISAQAWTANDLDAALQAGKSSPRFAEVVNLYANFTLDQARETQIANIRSQLDKLRATLRAMQVRQGEIEQAISTRKIELTPDQIAQRQAEGFAELQDIAKRLDYLTRITKWIQSGGTVEPGLSMEELESSPPPMQSMEELRGLLVQARGVQARLTDPSALREQELANYLLALREEQATLKAKVQPLTGAVALLEAKLQQISAQPVLLSNADRELMSTRKEKLRAMIER